MMNEKLRFFGTGLLITLAMYLGALFCFAAKAHGGFHAVFWVPNGISFTSLYLLGLEFWPFVVAGEMISYFSVHAGYISNFVSPFVAIGMNFLVVRFLKSRMSSKDPFSRLQDLLTFLIAAVVIAPLVCSLITTALYYFSGGITARNILPTWRAWWLGEGMGSLVVGSFFVNALNDLKHSVPLLKERKIEAVVLFLTILSTSVFIFTPLAAYNTTLLIKPYFLYTLMLYASLRFDLMGASTTCLIMATTAMVGETLGFVAFTSSTINDYEKMLMLQLIIAAISVTGSVVAATVREKTEALDAKNEFLDIASHELKTPITSLKLQLQLLQKKIDKQAEISTTDLEQKTFLTKVDRQVNRLIKIVEQLLDVSRAERSLMVLDREEIALIDLVQPLVERLSTDLQNAKCQVKLDIPTNLRGSFDPFRIEQILENLISNAIKYAPGSLIELIACRNGNAIELKVVDHGPGIDPDKQHSIFDRFVRASNVRHVQGLGLGLFITKRIIEAHGGSIQVESRLKSGTTFTVILPVDHLSVDATNARPQKA